MEGETSAAKTCHNSKPLLMEKHIILKVKFQRTWMRSMCVGFGDSRFGIEILLMFKTIRPNEFPLIKLNELNEMLELEFWISSSKFRFEI